MGEGIVGDLAFLLAIPFGALTQINNNLSATGHLKRVVGQQVQLDIGL